MYGLCSSPALMAGFRCSSSMDSSPAAFSREAGNWVLFVMKWVGIQILLAFGGTAFCLGSWGWRKGPPISSFPR